MTKKIVFSGDVGNTNQPLLRDPQKVAGADVLVMGTGLFRADDPKAVVKTVLGE